METYICSDMKCPKCKHKYSISFTCESSGRAKRLIRSLLQTPCSVCDNSNAGFDSSIYAGHENCIAPCRGYHEEFRPLELKAIQLEDNDGQVVYQKLDNRVSSWDKALTQVNSGDTSDCIPQTRPRIDVDPYGRKIS